MGGVRTKSGNYTFLMHLDGEVVKLSFLVWKHILHQYIVRPVISWGVGCDKYNKPGVLAHIDISSKFQCGDPFLVYDPILVENDDCLFSLPVSQHIIIIWCFITQTCQKTFAVSSLDSNWTPSLWRLLGITYHWRNFTERIQQCNHSSQNIFPKDLLLHQKTSWSLFLTDSSAFRDVKWKSRTLGIGHAAAI